MMAALAALTTLAAAVPATAVAVGGSSGAAPTAPSTATSRAACGAVAPGRARCLAQVRTDRRVRAVNRLANAGATAPQGYGPRDLASAYRVPSTGGKGQTVAVVLAYDNPNAERDLARYRATYGLPPCTTANGCFTKLNQDGKRGAYPPVDGDWALESALDVDMVSAACPACRIMLVEARSNYLDDLAKAVDTAVALGAHVVSNSYGADEFYGMSAYAGHYQHRGVPILASSGDWGFTAAQFPAVVPGVTAVGGTTLKRAANARGWAETAWWGAGSGCSAYVRKPTYQKDTHCHMRTVADLSAVADPDTGVAVYDTTPNYYGIKGWTVMGGTSVSSPFVAGLVAKAGHPQTFTTAGLYARRTQLWDVVGGSNGYCGGDYLCTGKAGYDGPTGLGTPRGLGAF